MREESAESTRQGGKITRLSQEQKINLIRDIKALDNSKLNEVVTLIEMECPKAFRMTDEENYHIAVDELDAKVVGKISK